MMKIHTFKLLLLSLMICSGLYAQSTSATLIKKVEGFSHPESVVFNQDKNEYYISNMADREEGDGFISRVSAEGEIIDYIQQITEKTDAIIINPGGLTHYSISLRDCLSDFNGRIIEVHLSNIHARESFRRESLIADICEGHIAGLGWYGYLSAINYLIAE